MNTGTFVLGLLNGLTIGLLAVGLVLVYKANRFLNLAHAQLGAVPAVLLAKAVLDWSLPWWIAFPGVLVVGVGAAVAVERWIVRPVRTKGGAPLRLLLLTLAVSQLLLALTFVPWLTRSSASATAPYPQPFRSSLTIGEVVLNGMDLLTLVLVPAIVIALGLFLQRSSTGKQLRAAASNPDAARLCGVRVGRISAVAWGIAGGLATVSAVLAAPLQSSMQTASLGPQLLLVTLGAAAAGAFQSLPAALAGGLAIGMTNQVVTGITSQSSNGALATFLVILAIVALRGRALGRVFEHSSPAESERSIVRIPAALRSSPVVRHHAALLGGGGLLIAVVAPWLPGLSEAGEQFRLVLLVIFALLGVSLTMLLGWAGQVSLGHGALLGVGSFLTARVVASQGLSLPLLLLIAGAAGAAVVTVAALPALRIPGFTLAIVTLGLAVTAPEWLFRQEWLATDRPDAVPVPVAQLPRSLGSLGPQLSLYYVALGVLVLAILGAAALRRSIPGRLVIAARDNERALSSFGVAPSSVKLAIVAVSGFYAGAAGVLWAYAWRLGNVDHFGPDLSVGLLALPVIGGLGSIGGAVVAAVAVHAPNYFLAPHLFGLLGDFARSPGVPLALGGLGQMAVVMHAPRGLAGLAQKLWQAWLDRRAERVEAGSPATTATPVELVAEEPMPSVPPLRIVTGQLHRLVGAASGDDALPLVVDNVSLRFGGIVALDGAALTVRPGEIVGLIGPNGAGKSTLLNVISGALSPASGTVHLFGHDVTDLSPDLRAAFGLSRSFQHSGLFNGLTVAETMQVAMSRRWMVRFLPAMAGAPWSRYADEATAADAAVILERFGLTSWSDSLCADLSTGTRRICDLAAQVAAEPRILLLDEPTGGVAQREAEAFGPLVRRIRDELDCSIVVVEHDMPLLMGLCDRVLAMDLGRVIAEGTPEEVRSDPLVIATYLGSNDTAIARSGTELTRSD